MILYSYRYNQHDLLLGVYFFRISKNKTTPALSHQSAYSAVQLLACLSSLAPQISTSPGTILSSALVLEALMAYQPGKDEIVSYVLRKAVVDFIKNTLLKKTYYTILKMQITVINNTSVVYLI